MKNIILTGGGTAGHCMPNIYLLPYLKEYFNNIYYIGSKNGIEKNIICNNNIPYYEIDCAKLNRKFNFNNLKIPFSVTKGIISSEKIIEKLKPNVVFSKGGYVSFPVVVASHRKKIPVISHESDLTLGLANKLSIPFCTKILTSFKETAKQIKKGEYVGPPLKKYAPVNKKEILRKFNFENGKPVLLITGGSQGAQKINEAVKNSVKELSEFFNIIHLCGKGNKFDCNIKNYYQTEFAQNMNEIYSITSVCVSRAGSNTVFELLQNSIPTVLIPLSNSSTRGDQVLNAKYFFRKGACSYLEESLITKNSFICSVLSCLKNKQEYVKNIESLNIENSCPKIAETLFNESL